MWIWVKGGSDTALPEGSATLRIALIALVASLVLGLLALAYASTLHAQEIDECTVFLNSEPANNSTIELKKGDGVSVRGTAPEGTTRNNVYIVFFGKRFFISALGSAAGEFQGNMRVSEVANLGVGLYELVWEGVDSRGRVLCRAAGRVRILGSPLGSVAGLSAVAAMAVGLAGLALTLRATVNAGARWAIKAVARARVERGDEGDDDGRGGLRIRPSLSITHTLGGTLAGFFLGGGSLTTLQQAAVSPPTVELALQVVLPLTLLGLLAGLLRPEREHHAG
jgi:hypothetical protein